MTIDKALREYTDGNIDMYYYRHNMNGKDFLEFLDLIPYIDILKATGEHLSDLKRNNLLSILEDIRKKEKINIPSEKFKGWNAIVGYNKED